MRLTLIIAIAPLLVACTQQTLEQIHAVPDNLSGRSPGEVLSMSAGDLITPPQPPSAHEIDAGHYGASLAHLYLTGDGVTQDHAVAFRLYTAAAAHGDADALNQLGMFYTLGDSVARDDALAYLLFQRAIDAGSKIAITNLGWMTEQGRGVPADPAKAYDFYERAAALGEPIAKGNLARLDRAAEQKSAP